jgi:hypothetical protein
LWKVITKVVIKLYNDVNWKCEILLIDEVL